MRLSTNLSTMHSLTCTKHSFIYYFLCTALFLMNHVLTQERTPKEGFFKGPYSYALLPNSISLNSPITFSFRTCSFGEFLSQEGKNGDYLKIELAESGHLRLKWKVGGVEDTLEYSSPNLKNNLWHNVELRQEFSNSVLLKIDQLSSQIVSNSTTRTNLLSIDLNNDYPNLYIGKNYTGCILEGSSVPLNDPRVRSSDVTWDRCPLPNSRSCDGYEADSCFSNPCRAPSTCVSTPNGYKCECTARYSGENCDVDEGALCSRPEFNLCENNGECVEDSAGNLTYCVCRPNFAGYHCETPSNGSLCEQNTCNGGTCIANGNSIRCICPPGFAGDDCSLNINECESNPCLNNGTCIDEIGSYFCVCRDTGYKGPNCEENINECVEQNPCSSGSTCFDNYGSYVCVCPRGKGGKDCDVPLDDCSSQPCQNGGTCVARNSGYDCRCPLGFEGYSCEVNVDDCAIAMCPPNSHCIDGINRFTCECDEGFTGNPPNCSPLLSRIIESPSPICHTSSCFNGGTCLTEDGKNSTTCICAAGFTGHLCEARCEIQCSETGSCSPCNASACASNPCLNKRACRSTNNHSYICDCLPGWSGRNCDIPSVRASRLEDCQSQLCLHGVCSNQRCVCDVGYIGERCETPISSCESSPCLNGGTCESQVSSSSSGYTCNCPQGFTGANCEENINDCLGVTCPPYQVCYDLVNDHRCSCPDGFTGNDCSVRVDSCSSQPCVRGACLNGAGTYTCLCPPGYTGVHCESEINVCDPSPCVFGICQSSNGSYKCYCQPGYTGHNCNVEFNECLSNPCRNNGTCQNLVNDYNCTCAPGYTGKECEIDIDECASSPCVNGATCYDTINQYTCACQPGYNGTRCEIDIDECESSPCFHVEFGARCIDKVNGFLCDCEDSGFTGEFCEKNIDDCFSDPCVNGANCEDHVKNYTCHCLEGYKGINCEIDVNECESNPCQNGATCFEKSNSSLYQVNYLGKFPSFSYADASGYFCECQLGFTGDNCETNIDDCENHDCVNGTCVDGINNYHCECIPGFEGKDCSIDINECESQPCQNNATCDNLIADYSCKCHFGYGGKDCEIQLLGCRNDPCENNGECIPYLDDNQEHQFKCQCPVGFAGRTCELITIVSFRNGSSMDVSNSYKSDTYFYTYSLRFQFRTTLSEGILVHSTDSYNNLFIIIYLQDGSVNLAIQNYGILKNIKEDERAPTRNDGLWKDVSINITPNSANLSVSNWIQTDVVNSENIGNLNVTTFGGGLLPRNFAGYQTFIGCMREIYLNEQLVVPDNATLKGTEIGCHREEQCLEDTCSTIGHCKDYWFSYSCFCPRPYFGSTCQYSVTPATFGYKDVQSYAKVEVPEIERVDLTRSTNITLFLRTRQADGFIFYLGPNLFGENMPDQYGSESHSYNNTTFVAVFLENGYLKATTGLVENKIMEKKLNNGDYHFVKVFRNATVLSLSINETTQHVNIPENPLKMDVIFIGGLPKHNGETRVKRQIDFESENNAAVYNTHSWENITFFKGIIQDFRVNDMLLDIYPSAKSYGFQDKAPEVFPATVEANSVSEGVLSDNPCDSNPCTNGGTCIDTWNSYSCKCSEGYRGINCSEKEPCFIHQCPANSICRNLPIGYECLADVALKGDSVLKYKPNFSSNVTSDSISLKFRTQTPGGTLLHVVTNGFNNNHLTITVSDSVIIQWKFGYNENIGTLLVGTNVTNGDWHKVTIFMNETILKAVMDTDNSERIAEYSSVISLMQIVQDADFYVGGNTKPDGFFRGCLDEIRVGDVLLPYFARDALQNDESPNHFDLVSSSEGLHIGCIVCWDDLCQNNGKCLNATSDFSCKCSEQYSGHFCEEDVDECLESRCVHGACENMYGSFKCNCQPFYYGQLCNYEVNLCNASKPPCQNGGQCIPSFGNYSCNCDEEYTGPNCEKRKVIRCDNEPCENGATCIPVARHENIEFKCECNDRYEGEKCEKVIDYCSSIGHQCVNGTCVNTPTIPDRKTTCDCNTGYEGELCDTEMNPCLPNPCENGATCEKVGFENYACICAIGFQGTNCTDDIDECQLYPDLCKNGAFCTNLFGSYKCNCSELFAPPHCIVENPCLTYNCENNGECLPRADEKNMTSSPICHCAHGFNGTYCELKLPVPSTTDTLALAVGLSLAIICVICIIVAIVIFLRIAKKKRATRGTYSPSRQEMFGSRVEMNHVMKPPPEERLI